MMRCFSISYGVSAGIKLEDVPRDMLDQMDVHLAPSARVISAAELVLQSVTAVGTAVLEVADRTSAALVLVAPCIIDVGDGFTVRYSYDVSRQTCLAYGHGEDGLTFLILMHEGNEFPELVDGRPSQWTVYFDGHQVVKRLLCQQSSSVGDTGVNKTKS